MREFILKELCEKNIIDELLDIDFDKSYAPKAAAKYSYKNIKIFDLTSAQANILKQTALSVGADCATPRGVITGETNSANCILGGSSSALQKIACRLLEQPFGLKYLGETIVNFLKNTNSEQKNTKLMGILNVTQNSFSDGGMYFYYEDSIRRLNELIEEGADIIDIGAESTKPFSKPVDPDIQLEKLLPILEYISKNNIKIPVSIDTRSSKTAEKCLDAGAGIINDVSGFDFDDKMADVVSKYGSTVIIQHSKGTPENMQKNPVYSNLIDEIYLNLREKIEYAVSKGVKRENIIIDAGIGFGKTREHNFEIIRRIEEFNGLGCPVLLGLSRKSLLNMPDADNDTKDIYTLALNSIAIEKKVDIIRVHNVKLHKKLIDMLSV